MAAERKALRLKDGERIEVKNKTGRVLAVLHYYKGETASDYRLDLHTSDRTTARVIKPSIVS